VEDKMAEEEISLASEGALASLKRIERLLETIAETMQEYLEISRRLLASHASRVDAAQVDGFQDRPFVDGGRLQALTIRDVTISPSRHRVTVRDQPIELTPTEFGVLFCLMHNAGRVLSCQELVRKAQGYELDERDARYLIRPHITRLRQKLMSESGATEYIHNVRGIGYYFERRAKQRD
jgi:DNA-binding response OmpR family regulator